MGKGSYTTPYSVCVCVKVWVVTTSIYMGKAERGPKLRIFLSDNIAHAVGLKTSV